MGTLVVGGCIDNVHTTKASSGDNEAHSYDDDGNYLGMTYTASHDSTY